MFGPIFWEVLNTRSWGLPVASWRITPNINPNYWSCKANLAIMNQLQILYKSPSVFVQSSVSYGGTRDFPRPLKEGIWFDCEEAAQEKMAAVESSAKDWSNRFFP